MAGSVERPGPAFTAVSGMRAAVAGQAGAWVTTDYVLDETITRLFATTHFGAAHRFIEGIFEASRRGLVDMEHVTRERFTLAYALRLRYRDKPSFSYHRTSKHMHGQMLLYSSEGVWLALLGGLTNG